MDQAHNIKSSILVWLVLILATGLVYRQVLHHDFVNFDDLYYVTDNDHVQAGLTPAGLIWAFTTTDASNWHPLTWLSHMLDCELYGLNPGGHHLTNVLLHFANTLLLFLVLTRMTAALWRSALVAILFALHPLHVESVAWVAERKDVLSALFWMLTMWAYLLYVQHGGFKRYLLVLVAFTLGLMAKPMLVTLPFVLLLLDYWPLGRYQFGQSGGASHAAMSASIGPERSRPGALGLVLEKSPLLALAAISSVVTYLAQQSGQAVRSMETFPLTVRIANALVSYVTYIGKTIWPANLTVFYPHPGDTLPMWQTAGAGLLLAFISIGMIRAVRKHPYLAVGWLWYLGTLVPVIGLVQVGEQAMADRYTYVPLIGLFIIAAWGLWDLGGKWHQQKIVFAVVLLLALTVCTWRQLHHWRNSISLWEHALAVTKKNALAYNNLGAAQYEKGKLEEASENYLRALEIKPELAKAHNNLGVVLDRQGRHEEAISHYVQALKIKPDYAEAYNNLGTVLSARDKLDEAILHYVQALKIKPDYAEAHNNLGAALYVKNKLEEAIGHYRQALKIRPSYAEAHNNMAVALQRQNKLDEAIRHYRQALKIEPDYATASYRLALAFTTQGRTDEAITQYRRTLHLEPNWPEVLNNLAWILATHENPKFRNGDEAIQLAEKACELTGHKRAEILDTLAAAYAEAAQFGDASLTSRKATEMALEAGKVDLANLIRRRTLLYKVGKPFHEK